MFEDRTITTLVPRIAAGTLLVLVAGAWATANGRTGNLNRPMYLAILAFAVVMAVIFLRTQRSTRLDALIAVLASCGLVWGIWSIERPRLLPGGDWGGFGYRVALAVAVLVLLMTTVLRPRHFSNVVRVALWVVLSVCCLCDAIGLIRTIDYMPYVNSNLNVINDMLGPIVGKIPASTFAPEYTGLYGWLFVPLQHLSPLALVGVMSIFLTVLGVVTVGLAVWIARGILGSNGLLVAVALVVPITFVTSHESGDMSSIASLFPALPIRLLAGFLVIAVGLTDLVLLYRGTLRARHLVLTGVVCGLVTWNSQDFGLAATVVYGFMIVTASKASVRWRAAGMWLAGLLIGAASYPVFLLATGHLLDPGLVGIFDRLFGSGLGTAAIQVPGPVLVILPIIICSTAVGWALLRARHRQGAKEDAHLDRATVALAFVGTWSAVCLVYYINRAYAAGQLQTMLLPCGICVASLVSIAIHSGLTAQLSSKADATPSTRVINTAKMLPVGIFTCLCFACVLLSPDPILAARTLAAPPPMSGYTTYDLPQITATVAAAQSYTSHQSGALTYLGESFNFVTLQDHVPSNAIVFPFSLADHDTAVIQFQCRYLEAHHSRWMVLSLDSLSAFGPDACGMYHPVAVPGLLNGQLQELG